MLCHLTCLTMSIPFVSFYDFGINKTLCKIKVVPSFLVCPSLRAVLLKSHHGASKGQEMSLLKTKVEISDF